MTYPKDGEGKVRESNKQLRAQVKRLRKENEMLRQELANIVKPVRPRKESVIPPGEPREKYEDPKMTREEWRQDFIKKFKPRVDKCLKETEDEEDES